jgi:hypothetical protein
MASHKLSIEIVPTWFLKENPRESVETKNEHDRLDNAPYSDMFKQNLPVTLHYYLDSIITEQYEFFPFLLSARR